MTELERLIEAQLAGRLDAEEEATLAALLASSEDARRTHRGLLEVEACLRGQRHDPALARAVSERLQSSRERTLAASVMKELRARKTRAPARWVRRLAAAGLLLAGAAFASLLVVGRARKPVGAPPSTPAAAPTEAPATSKRPQPSVPEAPHTFLPPPRTVEVSPEPAEGYAQDFEDPASESALRYGARREEPGPSGGRFVAQGSLNEYSSDTWLVTIALPRGPDRLTWSPRLMVELDVWLGARGDVHLNLWIPRRGQNYQGYVSNLPAGQWSHVVLAASDLRPVLRPEVAPEPGDAIENVAIGGGRVPDAPLVIDNLRIVSAQPGGSAP